MSFKKIFISLLGVSCSLVASCSPNMGEKPNEDVVDYSKYTLDKFDKYIALPSGAPTLATHKIINEKKAHVIKNAKDISALFSNGEFPFLVFDASKGQKIIDNQGENAKYKFVKMLTGGNFHLFAFDKTIEQVKDLVITADDYVLGFQEHGTPSSLFRSIYNIECDTYLDSISNIKDMLLSMDENYRVGASRQKLDYAIVAEPAATAIKSSLTNKKLKVVDIDLQKEFQKKFSSSWDKKHIVQAGLFIKNSIPENEQCEIYSHVMNSIDLSITNALTNPLAVKTSIESIFSQDTEQVSNYGFLAKLIPAVQGKDGSKNGFGIVNNDIKFNISDIKTFNSLLNSK